jgi:hypothetical protein
MLLPEDIEMFKLIAPQKAQHSLGFIVQTGGPYAVQYVEKTFMAEVKADLTCTIVPLYIDTLALNKADSVPSGITKEHAELIINRIIEGLDCLGVKCKICKKHP